MKTKNLVAFFILLVCLLFDNDTRGQNIRGDTIYVDANSVVSIMFPSSPGKAELLIKDGQEGLYEVSDLGKKSISIKALKSGKIDQHLEVTEGGRKHLFILSYKEGSPALNMDFSTRKKLTARADEKKKELMKVFTAANSLYDQAKTNNLNQALWKEVEAKYEQLANVADPKDAALVKSRLEESRKVVLEIREKNYKEAMTEGQNHFSQKKFGQARNAYQNALQHKPDDPEVLKYFNIIDSAWARDYIDKGDEAYKAKKYVLAKANYKEAFGIKPDFPFARSKFIQAKKDADPLIYKIEKEKADKAMKAYDLVEARRAYDSALAVKPGDKHVIAQLKNLIAEEKKIEEEEKQEAQYQAVLVAAKSLEKKASNQQDYDLAIKEYRRALTMMPFRKFPTKKINELTKLKKPV